MTKFESWPPKNVQRIIFFRISTVSVVVHVSYRQHKKEVEIHPNSSVEQSQIIPRGNNNFTAKKGGEKNTANFELSVGLFSSLETRDIRFDASRIPIIPRSDLCCLPDNLVDILIDPTSHFELDLPFDIIIGLPWYEPLWRGTFTAGWMMTDSTSPTHSSVTLSVF